MMHSELFDPLDWLVNAFCEATCRVWRRMWVQVLSIALSCVILRASCKLLCQSQIYSIKLVREARLAHKIPTFGPHGHLSCGSETRTRDGRGPHGGFGTAATPHATHTMQKDTVKRFRKRLRWHSNSKLDPRNDTRKGKKNGTPAIRAHATHACASLASKCKPQKD